MHVDDCFWLPRLFPLGICGNSCYCHCYCQWQWRWNCGNSNLAFKLGTQLNQRWRKRSRAKNGPKPCVFANPCQRWSPCLTVIYRWFLIRPQKDVISPWRKPLFLHATQRSWILKFARLRARKESRREVLDHFLVEGIAGCHYWHNKKGNSGQWRPLGWKPDDNNNKSCATCCATN